MTGTADFLWAAVLDNPRDAAPKLALADLLDEAGTDPELAAGLRWSAANNRFPTWQEWRPGWAWYWIVPGVWKLNGRRDRYRIPKEMWDAIGCDFDQGPDARDALRRVGEYLLTLP